MEMVETLKKLKKKWGTIRTSTSTLIDKIDELIILDKPEEEKMDEMEEYWDLLIEKEKTLKEMGQEIFDGIDVEQNLQHEIE